ncbi:HepT-like ribonuclease domain-containing protein [Bacteroides uniformis]
MLFSNYPQNLCSEMMKLRDLIAHHYFRIDVDLIQLQ